MAAFDTELLKDDSEPEPQEIAYRRFPNLIEQAELRTDILLVA